MIRTTIHQTWRIRARVLAVPLLGCLLLLACGEPEPPTVNLYRAIHVGDLNQIKRHLHWGTDVNQPDPDGDMPLHVAARRGRVVIAEELLAHGAEVDARNAAGRTPLQVALIQGKTQLARVLLKQGAQEDPQSLLFLLAREGVSDRDSLDLLVELGADVNTPNEVGSTPLHVAVADNHLLVTKRLVDLRADVNARDGEGRTPLAIAVSAGYGDIVAALEPFGARLDQAE